MSAHMEWRVVKAVYPDAPLEQTPWGEAFERSLDVGGRPTRAVAFRRERESRAGHSQQLPRTVHTGRRI